MSSMINGQLVEVKNEPDRRFRDAWVDSGGGVIEIDYAVALPKHQADTIKKINDEAEEIRLKYITPGSGQAMVYREKLDEAEAIQAQDEAAIEAMSEGDIRAQYPLVAASIGIEAADAWDVAALVRSKFAEWATIAHEIEFRRLSAIDRVLASVDVDEVDVAYEALSWDGL